MSKLPKAFSPDVLSVPLSNLLPSRKLPTSVLNSVKYQQIMASIQEIGLIEPLSVTQSGKGSGQYLVLDGHARLMALTELGVAEAPCLEANDDEGYTYNTRINRLSSIQETRMLQAAAAKGVSRETLARALNVDPSLVSKKLRLLEGICPEAVELLKDRQFSPEISRFLRRMKPTRQVECIELMLTANSLTVNYAEALLAATPVEMLVAGKKPEHMKGLKAEQVAKMEREMASLQGQYKLIEESYSEDVLNLVLAQRYLSKLLANEAIARFVRLQNPEILEQLMAIADAKSLD